MSFTRKIIDGARSGLSSIVDRVAADDTPLSHVSEARLQGELAARKARPARPAPEANPRARLADSSEGARARRAKLASEREGRVRSRREASERKRAAQRDAAWRRMKEEAARQGASSAGSAGAGSAGGARPGGARTGGATGRGGFGRRTDPRIAEHYRTLNLPYGADFVQVKAAYRQLMRKYHPDLHGASPQKQKAATELTMRVTAAYNELEQHLQGGPNKS